MSDYEVFDWLFITLLQNFQACGSIYQTGKMFSVTSTEIGRGRSKGGNWQKRWRVSATIFHQIFSVSSSRNMVSYVARANILCMSPDMISASQAASGYGPPPAITFDRFVRACVTVKTLTEAFQRCVQSTARLSFVINVLGSTRIAMVGYKSVMNNSWMCV